MPDGAAAQQYQSTASWPPTSSTHMLQLLTPPDFLPVTPMSGPQHLYVLAHVGRFHVL